MALLLTNQLSFVFALDLSTATTVALLFGTLPIFTALIARLSASSSSAPLRLAAALSFGGVVLVTAGSDGGLSGNLLGNLLAVLGAATWGGYSVAIAPLMQRYSPFRLSAIFLLAVFLALVVLVLRPAGRAGVGSRSAVGSVRLATLGPLVLTNLLWFTAIDQVGPRARRCSRTCSRSSRRSSPWCCFEELTMLQVAGGFCDRRGHRLLAARSPEPT